MLRPLAILVVVAIVAVACSGGDDGAAPGTASSSEAGADIPDNTGNPGTLVAPTTTTEAPEFLLPIAPTVAFLDACIADAGLVGPCHCASERLGNSFTQGDLVVFEDRLGGRNEFSPEVAAALVDCRDAGPPAAWSAETIDTYVARCSKGSPRLTDLCRCSVSRAQDVIPEIRLSDYLASDDVEPNLVDLINICI
ncbi:MAG: hypothetical protein P8N02_10060 [Actinomycetota bacterium]|nr:hypothetical protein [Actinomycetota bacterium]